MSCILSWTMYRVQVIYVDNDFPSYLSTYYFVIFDSLFVGRYSFTPVDTLHLKGDRSKEFPPLDIHIYTEKGSTT